MGALSEAIARSARTAGAKLHIDSPVRRIVIDQGRAKGVELEDGRVIEARTVVSGVDPCRTFLGLVGADQLPAEVVADVEAIDFRSPCVKINLALDGLPRFKGSTDDKAGPEHRGTIHVGAQTLDELEAAFAAACRGELPERPMVELTLPSVLDDSIAPDGHHVGSMFVQYAPHDLDAAAWDSQRDRFADRVFAMVDEVAPGFSDRVVHREVLAPPDLERIFGLTGGNIFHGAMGLDRLAFMRPFAGWARYRTPIDGLYLCGAGTHPGGGVMGACGRNAAAAILRDRKRWS
jgi:phytoene dehydrogenase-like protein